ncbi:hypothetical protein V5799_007738, partial [Amblyomma americanum]
MKPSVILVLLSVLSAINLVLTCGSGEEKRDCTSDGLYPEDICGDIDRKRPCTPGTK